MSLRIEQTARYLGEDRWAWTVRLAGPADALAAVSRVSWHLHPSFTPSVVEVSDPRDGFALSSSGWGTFELRALLKLHSGAETELRHELALFYPDTDGDPALERESPRRAPAAGGGGAGRGGGPPPGGAGPGGEMPGPRASRRPAAMQAVRRAGPCLRARSTCPMARKTARGRCRSAA